MPGDQEVAIGQVAQGCRNLCQDRIGACFQLGATGLEQRFFGQRDRSAAFVVADLERARLGERCQRGGELPALLGTALRRLPDARKLRQLPFTRLADLRVLLERRRSSDLERELRAIEVRPCGRQIPAALVEITNGLRVYFLGDAAAEEEEYSQPAGAHAPLAYHGLDKRGRRM